MVSVFQIVSLSAAASVHGAHAHAHAPSALQADFLRRAESFINCSATYSNDHGDITRVAIERNPAAPTKPVIQNDYNGSLASMAHRSDCSDFGVPNIIRVLYSKGPHSLDTDPIKREQLKQGILGWQYWIDQIEGTKPDNHFQGGMEVWTENHQMDFHVSEYLAGMLYPDEMFWGTNMTGRQHADTGRGFVMRWLERRYRWGFSEWRSATYYQFCFHSVTTLASLAPEPLVATRAGIVLDLMMLDVSLHSLHGMLASSQGRSYGDSKWSWHGQGTATLSWLLTGDGLGYKSEHPSGNCDDGTALCVALLGTAAPGLPNSHLVSDVILAIAKDANTRTFVARERLGVGPEEPELAAETNLTLSTEPAKANIDAYVWMGMGNYAHPKVLPMIVATGNNLGLFAADSNETTFLGAWMQFANLSAAEITAYAQKNTDGMTYYGTLGPAETYLWRSPHVALSSLTDFVDKGAVGDQQHAWQATLNGSAVVFTTHPGPDIPAGGAAPQRLPSGEWYAPDDYSDGYWTGSASLPRIGQKDNVNLILYRPHPQIYANPALRESMFPFNYTHAGFDHTQFDELADELSSAKRIAGRVGDGYVALFAASNSETVEWATLENSHYNCSDGDHKSCHPSVIASTDSHGRSAWACVVGDKNTHGSFANFITSVLKPASLSYSDDDEMAATLSWPGGLELKMAWDGAMTTNDGVDVPLASHMRYENPYVAKSGVTFPLRGAVRFAVDGKVLELDFDKGIRRTIDV